MSVLLINLGLSNVSDDEGTLFLTLSDFCEPYLFLYRNVLPNVFCSTAAGSIDGVLGVGDEEDSQDGSREETAAAAAVGDVPELTVMSFLMHIKDC